ncbi:hypothetical protein SH1V18_47800 [Vallitalea longa]|uniref:Uncharacterized protein n=1 Tax=Vallitalea longa TaxID=2936439 RepID=A0A9W5YGY2_9FIRM|nr:hypothetical protein [Vallitalea longa]GKX32300.1 hypothetical protein SH1V18_47800 [Vallitalea longa]
MEKLIKVEALVKSKADVLVNKVKRVVNDESGMSFMGLLLVLAAVIIVGAFVLIPGLRDFADDVVEDVENWYTNTISSKMFPTT